MSSRSSMLPSSPVFRSSKYVVLHKIAIANWKPTKQATMLNKEVATFIFKIGTGIPINFGLHVFNSLEEFGNTKSKNVLLPFPCIVCSVVLAQAYSVLLHDETTVKNPPAITIQARTSTPKPKPKPKPLLLKDKSHSTSPAVSLAKNVVEEGTVSTTSYLDRRLLGISRARDELDKEEKEIKGLLAQSKIYAKATGAGTSSGKAVKFNPAALEGDSEDSKYLFSDDDEVEDSETPVQGEKVEAGTVTPAVEKCVQDEDSSNEISYGDGAGCGHT